MMFAFLRIILILGVFAVGAYLMNGGWAENFGSLYRNYRASGLSLINFTKSVWHK